MKFTVAEFALVAILVTQVLLVGSYDLGTNSYPKIYEDVLGMIAAFLLCIFSFVRSVIKEIK